MYSFKVTYWDKGIKYIRLNDNWETIIANLKFHKIDKNNLIKIERSEEHMGV